MNRIRKISLKEGEVVCVKLVEAKYTLAQMRNNGIMQFFDISNTNPSWPVLDLNRVSSLFYVFVSDQALSPIFLGKVLSAVVTPSAEPVPKLMLSAIFNPGNLGARLIELTKKYSSLGGGVIKDRLDPQEDWDIIRGHEMCGLHTDPEKLRKRLLRYFETA
ncbi:hypothetical protein IP92_05973 [Pseudoduganella flava]|uniref:Uncharacterized protein n=1 Tax=Pseudoduganella flava TaxID=871742 RepID=A0A562P4W1_9BURK|nr:hypothetical protein IP92_05973 [Pseudoduganella flava]